MTPRYVLYSTKLTGQMPIGLSPGMAAVLERLMDCGGFEPGTDGKVTIERYCNLAERKEGSE